MLFLLCIFTTIVLVGCSNEAQTSLTDIQTAYANQDYDSAIDKIEDFRTLYAEKDQKRAAEVEKIADEIEKILFENISSKSNDKEIEAACNEYLDYFSNGQYIDSVKSQLAEAIERIAIEDINTAKEYIDNKDYLEADSLLQNIINNTKVSEKTIGQAQELANSIANTVKTEKAKKAIVGTWKKQTGVCYTFQEDGSMSISLPGNYDKSAGTTLDGHEVTQILKDIEIYGRPRYGGTWEYIGQTEDYPTYRLYQQGSRYTCVIADNEVNGTLLGIQLESGLGGISILSPQ